MSSREAWINRRLDLPVEDAFPDRSERWCEQRRQLRDLASEYPRRMMVKEICELCKDVWDFQSRGTFYNRLRQYFKPRKDFPGALRKTQHKSDVLDTIHALLHANERYA